MIRLMDSKMGRFSVILELANNDDLAGVRQGYLTKGRVRRATIPAVVDTGAALMVIPAKLQRELGLTETRKIRVRYADGRSTLRPLVGGVFVEYAGRSSVFDAVVESKRETALLGVIVMEALDLIVDPTNQKLVPRDPKYLLYEIE